MQGANIADVEKYVENFHEQHNNTSSLTDAYFVRRRLQNVDDCFQRKIWTWLTKQPGVYTRSTLQDSPSDPAGTTIIEECAQGEDVPGFLSSQSASVKANPARKIYASEEQIWLAAAGHAQDYEKVPRLDFICLTVIASSREEGILQPDLVKITGQDKRSVPSRTQRLADRGYIQKLPIFTDSKRTSLLLLSKFAETRERKQSSKTAPDSGHSQRKPDRLPSSWGHNKFRPCEDLISQALAILEVENLLIWDELKKKLDVIGNRKLSRRLAEAVRKFENLGVLQRVRARSILNAGTSKSLHRCVKFIRQANETDWALFFDTGYCRSSGVGRPREKIRSRCKDTTTLLGDQSGDEQDYDSEVDFPASQVSYAALPVMWTPDRQILHVAYHALAQNGEDGLSLQDIRRRTTGVFFSRPLEQIIGRLVNYWQISQPEHLRHLAVIRDAAQTGSTGYYVHFTYPAFDAKVQRGQVDWNAVQTLDSSGPSATIDGGGFTTLLKSQFQNSANNATLTECIFAGTQRLSNLSKRKKRSALMDIRSIASTSQTRQGQIAVPKRRGRPHNKPTRSEGNTVQQEAAAPSRSSNRVRKSSLKRKHFAVRAGHRVDSPVDAPLPQVPSEVPLERGINADGCLPKSSRKFAQVHQEDIAPLFDNRQYSPSVLAHSTLVPLMSRERIVLQGLSQYDPGRSKLDFPASYLPSPLANGSPRAGSHNRKGSVTRRGAVALRYLPSAAAHGGTIVPWLSDRNSSELGHTDEDVSLADGRLYSRPVLKHKGTGRGKSASSGPQINSTLDRKQVMSRKIPSSRSLTYEEQSSLIHRPHDGIFVTPTTPLKTVGSRGRPRKSRLIIIKLSTLQSLSCFTKRHPEDNARGHLQSIHMLSPHFPDPLPNVTIEMDDRDGENFAAGTERFCQQRIKDPQIHACTGNDNKPSIDVPLDNQQRRKRKISSVGGHTTSTPPKRRYYSRQLEEASAAARELRDAGEKELAASMSGSADPPNGINRHELELTGQDVSDVASRSASTVQDQFLEKIHEPNVGSITDNTQGSSTYNVPHSTSFTPCEHMTGQEIEKELAGQGSSHATAQMMGSKLAKQHPSRVKKVHRFGGSTAHAKRKAFFDVILQNGGAYAAGRQLWQVVSRAISSVVTGSIPDKRTIQQVRSALIADRLLQEIHFTYRNAFGIMQERTILALSELDPQDAKIREIQNQIKMEEQHGLPASPETLASEKSAAAVSDRRQGRRAGNVALYANQLPIERCVVKSLFPRRGTKNQLMRSNPIAASREYEASKAMKRSYNKRSRASATVGALNPTQHQPDAPGIQKRREDDVTESLFSSEAQHASLAETYTENNSINKRRGTAQGKHALSRLFYPFSDTHGRRVLLESDHEALPSTVFAAPKGDIEKSKDPREVFNSMVDEIAAWERENVDDSRPLMSNAWIYYNRPEQALISLGPPVLADSINSGRAESQTDVQPLVQNIAPKAARQSADKRKRTQVCDSHLRQEKRRKRSHAVTESQVPEASNAALRATASLRSKTRNQTRSKAIRSRRPRARYNFKQEDDRLLLLAVVIARVLLGGIELSVNWEVVSKMLDHRYDPELLKRRWSSLRLKFTSSMNYLYSAFRSTFIRAYSDGSLPALNFDNVEEYDWEILLAWSVDHLDGPISADLELPPTKRQLHATRSVEDCGIIGAIDYYEVKHPATIPQRHSFLHQDPRYTSKWASEESPRDVGALDLVKNRITANVITPQATYNPALARDRLAVFSPELIEQALSELMSERKIAQENKGRATPGRTYHLAEQALSSLRLNLTRHHLAEAKVFKASLDERFQADDVLLLDAAPDDAQMMVLINMISYGQVQISQARLPSNKFGLTTENYRTRSVDKTNFNFDTVISLTDSYVYGSPLAPLPRIPTGLTSTGTQSGETKLLPAWVDINGDAVCTIWQDALCAVLGVLAVASCTLRKDIERKLDSSLKGIDIELVLGWLVEAGAASWASNLHDHVLLEAWWWTLIE